MGLFYTKPATDVAALAVPRLQAARNAAPPQTPQEIAAAANDTANAAGEIAAGARPTFSLPRFLCAVAFVVVLFLLYYWSAHDEKMTAHSDGLYHLFEILTSGLTILLVGESSSA
jgi:hypothetical protein